MVEPVRIRLLYYQPFQPYTHSSLTKAHYGSLSADNAGNEAYTSWSVDVVDYHLAQLLSIWFKMITVVDSGDRWTG